MRRTYHAGVAPDATLDIEQVHRLSLDEYHRLIESGGFDEDARMELIDGLLVDMSPKTREHENAIAWLADRLMGGSTTTATRCAWPAR